METTPSVVVMGMLLACNEAAEALESWMARFPLAAGASCRFRTATVPFAIGFAFSPEMTHVLPEHEIAFAAAKAEEPAVAEMLCTWGLGAFTVHSVAAGPVPVEVLSCRFRDTALPGVALADDTVNVTVWPTAARQIIGRNSKLVRIWNSLGSANSRFDRAVSMTRPELDFNLFKLVGLPEACSLKSDHAMPFYRHVSRNSSRAERHADQVPDWIDVLGRALV
jgi:hypothetical protein